ARLLPLGGVEVQGFLVKRIEQFLGRLRRLVVGAVERLVQGRFGHDHGADRHAQQQADVVQGAQLARVDDGDGRRPVVSAERQKLVVSGESQGHAGQQFGGVLTRGGLFTVRQAVVQRRHFRPGRRVERARLAQGFAQLFIVLQPLPSLGESVGGDSRLLGKNVLYRPHHQPHSRASYHVRGEGGSLTA